MTFDFTGTEPAGPRAVQLRARVDALRGLLRRARHLRPDRSRTTAAASGRSTRSCRAGTLVNPRPPAPVNCRTATIKRIADTILGALVQALPERMPAASSGTLLVMAFGGTRSRRRAGPFVASELAAGGMGARPAKDGIDVVETDVTNCMNIPVEALEMNFPLRVHPGRPVDGLGRRRAPPRGGLGPREGLRGHPHRRHGRAQERAVRLGAVGALRRRPGAARARLHRPARRDARGACPPRGCSCSIPATSSGSTSRAAPAGATRSSATRTGCSPTCSTGWSRPRRPRAELRRRPLDRPGPRSITTRPRRAADAPRRARGPIDWVFDRGGEHGREG